VDRPRSRDRRSRPKISIPLAESGLFPLLQLLLTDLQPSGEVTDWGGEA
jgi:hypothetical protein